MARSTLDGETLTLGPGRMVGTWIPARPEDRRLLERITRPRQGDPIIKPDLDRVGYLVALCATRGVRLIFDPTEALEPPPSPAPTSGQGGRRKR